MIYIFHLQGMLAESLGHMPCVWEIWSSVPGRVKPMTCKIDTCRYLVRWMFDINRIRFAQCQDNMAEWDIGSWCW